MCARAMPQSKKGQQKGRHFKKTTFLYRSKTNSLISLWSLDKQNFLVNMTVPVGKYDPNFKMAKAAYNKSM